MASGLNQDHLRLAITAERDRAGGWDRATDQVPATEAGRELLELAAETSRQYDRLRRAILAIEAESRAAERQRVEARRAIGRQLVLEIYDLAADRPDIRQLARAILEAPEPRPVPEAEE